jgi:hypothetical protein
MAFDAYGCHTTTQDVALLAVLIASPSLAAQLAAARSSGLLPTPERFAADVRSGAIDPAAFDFALAGCWGLDAAARTRWRDAVHRALGWTQLRRRVAGR